MPSGFLWQIVILDIMDQVKLDLDEEVIEWVRCDDVIALWRASDINLRSLLLDKRIFRSEDSPSENLRNASDGLAFKLFGGLCTHRAYPGSNLGDVITCSISFRRVCCVEKMSTVRSVSTFGTSPPSEATISLRKWTDDSTCQSIKCFVLSSIP